MNPDGAIQYLAASRVDHRRERIMQVKVAFPFRIGPDEVQTRRSSGTSLMPTGLLKDAKPEEVADLYAYLQSLSQVMPKTGLTRAR